MCVCVCVCVCDSMHRLTEFLNQLRNEFKKWTSGLKNKKPNVVVVVQAKSLKVIVSSLYGLTN